MTFDPNSLVDYLRARRLAHDFVARRRLWSLHNPRVAYSGTATQNTELLQELRWAEAVPELELTQAVYNVGDTIAARVMSMVPVNIESGLSRTSFAAAPGTVVNLGRANSFGFVTVKVMNSTGPPLASAGTLALLPAPAGRVHAGLVTALMTEGDELVPIVLAPGEVTLFRAFLNSALANNAAVLKTAFAEAAREFVAPENWLGLAMNFQIAFTISIVATPVAGVVAFLTANSGDFISDFLKKAVAASSLSSAQKTDMLAILGRIDDILLLITLVGGGLKWKKSREICDLAGAAATVPGWAVESFAPEDGGSGKLTMAGKLFGDAVEGSVSLFCDVKPHLNK